MAQNKSTKPPKSRPTKIKSHSPSLSYLMFHAIKDAGPSGVWFHDVMKSINASMPISYSVRTFYYGLNRLLNDGVVTTQQEPRLKDDGSGHFAKAIKCFHVPSTMYRTSAAPPSKFVSQQNVTWKPAGTWTASEVRAIPNSVFDFATKLDV